MTTGVRSGPHARAQPPGEPAPLLRLLSSWDATGRRDLGSHLAHFGPLPELHGHGHLVTRFLDALDAAHLGGRGGAGFPAATKLRARRALRRSRGAILVVNAMEGEPGSLKDHVLLSCAPHLVLDGAQLAATAVGAQRIVVCIAAERGRPHHEDAASSVAAALLERRAAGHDRLPVEVARPPGHFVAGEESALTGWLDGGPGLPSFRPDKAAPLQVGRAPAVVHNAETLAHMALVARRDHQALTALVTVSGAVRRPGVFEVVTGMPLAAVIDLALPVGPPRAVLVGGYGGTWVGPNAFSLPYSADGLAGAGTSPGAGILIVLGDDACGVVETARIARYMAGQSAGQCGPCVFGLASIAEDLALLAGAGAEPAAVGRVARRAGAVRGRGACRHPDGVARMVDSALRVFAHEVDAHLAGACCARGGLRPGPPAAATVGAP